LRIWTQALLMKKHIIIHKFQLDLREILKMKNKE
jgi:hypothetical protein